MKKISQKILYVVIALLLGVITFLIFANQNKEDMHLKNTFDSTEWETYTNEEYGISVKHPKYAEIKTKNFSAGASITFSSGSTVYSGPIQRISIQEIKDSTQDSMTRVEQFDHLLNNQGSLEIGVLRFVHYVDADDFSLTSIPAPGGSHTRFFATRRALILKSSGSGSDNEFHVWIKETDELKRANGKKYLYMIEYTDNELGHRYTYPDLIKELITFTD